MTGEDRPVPHQSFDVVRAVSERLTEGLRVVEDSVDLVWFDRFDYSIRILRKALNLRHDRLNGLADLGQVLQRRVDIRRVVGQGLGKDVGVVKRRLNGIGIVGKKLVGSIDDRDALGRHRLDVPYDRTNLVRIDRLNEPIGIVGERLQARRQRPDLLAEFTDALERRVDSGRVISQAPSKTDRRS